MLKTSWDRNTLFCISGSLGYSKRHGSIYTERIVKTMRILNDAAALSQVPLREPLVCLLVGKPSIPEDGKGGAHKTQMHGHCNTNESLVLHLHMHPP